MRHFNHENVRPPGPVLHSQASEAREFRRTRHAQLPPSQVVNIVDMEVPTSVDFDDIYIVRPCLPRCRRGGMASCSACGQAAQLPTTLRVALTPRDWPRR